MFAGVKRRKSVVEVGEALARSAFQRDARREAVGRKAAVNRSEQLERALSITPAVEDPRERQRGVCPAGLKLHRAAQRLLVAASQERIRLGGQEAVEKPLDQRGGLRSGELGCDVSVAKRLDRGNALHPVGTRQAGLCVDVNLR